MTHKTDNRSDKRTRFVSAGILTIARLWVQTCFGRTGAWFACEGLLFGRGEHGATFTGNPLVYAAAAATIAVIKEEGLVERSRTLGTHLREGLQSIESLAGNRVREVRGIGLMVGIDFGTGCGDLVNMARERGVLLNCTADTVLRFLPPLVIMESELDRVMAVVEQL